jgi:hypothetical protein
LVKQLDPSTTTAEEVAQAARSLKQARWAGLAVGAAAGALALSPIANSDIGSSALAIIVLVVVAAGAYRVTYEILSRVLPPN